MNAAQTCEPCAHHHTSPCAAGTEAVASACPAMTAAETLGASPRAGATGAGVGSSPHLTPAPHSTSSDGAADTALGSAAPLDRPEASGDGA